MGGQLVVQERNSWPPPAPSMQTLCCHYARRVWSSAKPVRGLMYKALSSNLAVFGQAAATPTVTFRAARTGAGGDAESQKRQADPTGPVSQSRARRAVADSQNSPSARTIHRWGCPA